MIPNDDLDAAWLRAKIGWWALALTLAVVLIVVLGDYLGWFVFGIFLYYIARPLSRTLQRRGFSSGMSAAVTLGLVVLPFVTILAIITTLAFIQFATLELADFEQILELLFPNPHPDDLPTTVAELYPIAEDLATDPTVTTVGLWVRGVLERFLTATYLAFVTFVFAFVLVRDERRLIEWVRTDFIAEESPLDLFLCQIDEGLESIFFGYTLTIFAIMLSAGGIYLLLNAIAPSGIAIPQVLLLAIITGLASIIPFVGRTVVYVVIIGFLAVQAIRTDPTALWFPVVFYVVMGVLYDGIIRTYVRPRLSGRLFPMSVVLFAYLLGPVTFGWYGIFLGPIIMVVTVVFIQQRLPTLLYSDSEVSESDIDEL
ncbi:AI-2E family transporter [Natrinema gelatinilyticum]|uniref:AI-2E family transporter n=1 Tax=Natrinema gelatinilyticum TaxID=2961571 RepID=UPI0020C2695C|nr:AI-2E family transporter [Natrinema gelatinilyticum]